MNSTPTTSIFEKSRSFLAIKVTGLNQYVRMSGSLVDDVASKIPTNTGHFWYTIHSKPSIARFELDLDSYQRAALVDGLLVRFNQDLLAHETKLKEFQDDMAKLLDATQLLNNGVGPSQPEPKHAGYNIYNIVSLCDTATWCGPITWSSRMIECMREEISSSISNFKDGIKHQRAQINRMSSIINSGVEWVSITENTVVTTITSPL